MLVEPALPTARSPWEAQAGRHTLGERRTRRGWEKGLSVRLLVATARTNGKVEGDFDQCVEGELVLVEEPCEADRDDPDGPGCGCTRSFVGLGSRATTTTALVVDSPLSESDVREAVRGGLEDRGRIDPDRTTRDEADRLVDEAITRVAAVAEHFPVDTVVGRRGERVFPRIGR
jgi:hypothetical protein